MSDEGHLNRRLMRWEPEMIVNLPAGVGLLPLMVPGPQGAQRSAQP